MIKIPFIIRDEFSNSMCVIYVLHILLPLQTEMGMSWYLPDYQHNSCSSCRLHLEILGIAVVSSQIGLFEKHHILFKLTEGSKFCWRNRLDVFSSGLCMYNSDDKLLTVCPGFPYHRPRETSSKDKSTFWESALSSGDWLTLWRHLALPPWLMRVIKLVWMFKP